MQLTRNALGNLLNRYRAVLKKCRLNNALLALTLTGALALPTGFTALAASGGHVDGNNYIGDPPDYKVFIEPEVGDTFDLAAGRSVTTPQSEAITGHATLCGTYLDNKGLVWGVSHGIYGAYVVPGRGTGSVDVTGSSVTQMDVSAYFFEVPDEVIGGSTEMGNATNNTVTMFGGRVLRVVAGGRTLDGTASGNSATLEEGDDWQVFSAPEDARVLGGFAEKGNATNNTVKMLGGWVLGVIAGGHTFEGAATGNTVTVSAGTLGQAVGGQSNEGSASGNSVLVEGGGISDVFGGRVSIDNLYGRGTGRGDATGNTVTVSGCWVGAVTGGHTLEGTASDNTVTVSDLMPQTGVWGGVTGGYALEGAASGNKVTISVDNNTTVLGSREADTGLALAGGVTGKGDATDNSVTMSRGCVEGVVVGGHTLEGAALDNSVTIEGGKVLVEVAPFVRQHPTHP